MQPVALATHLSVSPPEDLTLMLILPSSLVLLLTSLASWGGSLYGWSPAGHILLCLASIHCYFFEIHPWSCSRLCFAHLRCCVVFHCVDMAQFIVLQLASLILFALVTTVSNPALSAVVTPVLWFLCFPQFQIATVN